MNDNIFKDIVGFIKEDKSLSKETKKSYIEAFEKISRGEEIDEEVSSQLVSYFELLFKEEEDKALINKDADRISELAELRVERDAIMTAIVNSALGNKQTSENL